MENFYMHGFMKRSLTTLIALMPLLLGAQEFVIRVPAKTVSQPASAAGRDYSRPVSEREKKDIAQLVNTLGLEPLVKVASKHAELKKIGERIEHIHPLRFLACIFTDEQMKAAMQALKSRSWIFDEFMTGIKGTLDQEMSRDNLQPHQIHHFSGAVGLDLTHLAPHFESRQWEGLIHTLITKIPRKNNPNRYNM